ncbi:ABC transporter ATP-binding protein [Roseimicrobium sp. ORNL1]|uniref:ABC transporter ATP-binding protein n=1 Tax=Roseimicrobium sp. ORNL1 TaxID=2711231 RepID=UPI0013E1F4CE|nr:ABC transporter ATP-binding protein [Roseimicrobium sp. ORNL1]QIF04475.1 ABC transporter ATP-binding protein [Roseimicrobium sp. ORNL1]
MSEPIIQVENLGKRYQIKHQSGERYTALRDVLARKVGNIFKGRKNGNASPASEEFWALKDVSFDIMPGEVVGIIGRNGAGKSTLLKILSRITEPTVGRITLGGRVASLLEVGTGFHPELTGRENIYLNGAILGMTKDEIRSKFDEIVAFAEVEKFLDTPVKRYSSGMYVRLAFAVAAHLEPEILVVDEVLAVGDAEFQKKCLGKMDQVAKGGRTVLFVSHNIDALQRICQTGIVLRNGSVVCRDDITSAINVYLSDKNLTTKVSRDHRPGIVSAEVSTSELREGRLKLSIAFSYPSAIANPTFGMVVYNEKNVPLFGSNTLFDPPKSPLPPCSAGQATVTAGPLPLWSGSYRISLWLSDGTAPLDHAENIVGFDYVSPDVPPYVPPPALIGSTRVPATWELSLS